MKRKTKAIIVIVVGSIIIIAIPFIRYYLKFDDGDSIADYLKIDTFISIVTFLVGLYLIGDITKRPDLYITFKDRDPFNEISITNGGDLPATNILFSVKILGKDDKLYGYEHEELSGMKDPLISGEIWDGCPGKWSPESAMYENKFFKEIIWMVTYHSKDKTVYNSLKQYKNINGRLKTVSSISSVKDFENFHKDKYLNKKIALTKYRMSGGAVFSTDEYDFDDFHNITSCVQTSDKFGGGKLPGEFDMSM